MDIESKRKIVVGVNAFRPGGPPKRRAQILPERLQGERTAKLKALKNRRRGSQIEEKLESVRSAAQRGTNTLPSISEAVKAGCTVGEISDALREVSGVYMARQLF